MDTVDIEDLAGKVKSSFVGFWTNFIYGAAVAQMPALAGPIVSTIVKGAIGWAVELMATKGGQVAFMINTGVFTRDQAKDFLEALRAIDKLPDNVSDEEWEKKENEANHAFGNLVNYTK